MWLRVSTRSIVSKDISCICHLCHQEAQLLQPEGTWPGKQGLALRSTSTFW